MTLLDRILARGVQMPTDPIIEVRLERHLRRIQPDPLFRRRVRGQVLNRYVAAREGLAPPAPPHIGRREMGALGRGVLYASLLTALGVSAVGAAAQESLPGDALYGVKLQLEQVRMQIAPAGLRDDLAAMALDERLEEVERLAAAGSWQLVDEAAARAATAEEQLAAMTTAGSAPSRIAARGSADTLQRHAERLEELLAEAPPTAHDGLKRAWEASTADEPPAFRPDRPEPRRPGQSTQTHGQPETPGRAPTTAPSPASTHLPVPVDVDDAGNADGPARHPSPSKDEP